MNTDELKTMLEKHKLWLDDEEGGKRADLEDANLEGADLRDADLRGANLRGANLQDAYLQDANLQYANLRDANLRGADLQHAYLRDANLRGADLRGADLRCADLDYACLPLWCGSKGVKVDKHIAAQLAAHFCALDCDDADYLAARTAILEFAKSSHLAEVLGLLEEHEQ